LLKVNFHPICPNKISLKCMDTRINFHGLHPA
jgi:hypothetical protein